MIFCSSKREYEVGLYPRLNSANQHIAVKCSCTFHHISALLSFLKSSKYYSNCSHSNCIFNNQRLCGRNVGGTWEERVYVHVHGKVYRLLTNFSRRRSNQL